MCSLGYLLEDTDADEARRWYERASELGNLDALFNLALCLEDKEPERAESSWRGRLASGDRGALGALARPVKVTTRRPPRPCSSRPCRPATPLP